MNAFNWPRKFLRAIKALFFFFNIFLEGSDDLLTLEWQV